MTLQKLIIYRPFEGMEVKQEVDTLLYNATDMLKAYNYSKSDSKDMWAYLKNQSTKDYIELLYQKENSKDENSHLMISEEKPKVEWVISVKRGKFGGTWMNQHLLVDFMMWLSPEFKHAAISFILDGQSLSIGRNKIKEWYKRMCLAIAESGSSNYRDEATMLNVLTSWSPSPNQRARYGADKIELMDDMQKSNSTMIRLWLPIEQRKNALVKEFLS